MNIQPELRIGDAERAAAASALGEHFASGRLTREEYDERSTLVWSAKTNSDLWPLFADLPSPHVEHPPAGGVAPALPRGYGRAESSHRRWRGVPFIPMILLIVLVIALPGPAWLGLLLLWLWIAGFFRGTWFGGCRRSGER